MPESESPLVGIQRRAAEDPNARFRAFDSYPWTKDRAFTEQLSGVLNNTQSGESSLSEIALQSRIQRFEQQTQINVNADGYKQWLAQNNLQQPRFVSEEAVAVELVTVPNPDDRKLAHLLVELGDPLGQLALQQANAQLEGAPVPSWQSAAPTAELYVQKDSASTDSDKEPYPKRFEEILEFLQSGKPIPGIKEIPDTVIDDPAITARGNRTVPPKPWEVGRNPSTNYSATLVTEGGT